MTIDHAVPPPGFAANEPMDRNFLPAILMKKCAALVRMVHDKFGLNGLPAKITTSDYMPVLAFFLSDTFAVMRVVSLCFKLKMASWVVTLICLVLSLAWSLWLLIGVAAGSLAAMLLAKKERDGWLYCATVLLGLEILATDFFGWGTAYPDLRDKALWVLNYDPAHPKTTWLDFYLPRRASLDPDKLREFWAPSGVT
jgi:pimeloyl-ACP methyl ester carboxylesterase